MAKKKLSTMSDVPLAKAADIPLGDGEPAETPEPGDEENPAAYYLIVKE